jgi:hypothetical protein
MSALPHFPMAPDDPFREPTLDDFTRDLARACQYRLADVEANSHGFMSSPQFLRLFWQATKPLRHAVVTLAAWSTLLIVTGSIFHTFLLQMLIFQSYAFEAVAVSISLLVAVIVAFLNTTSRTWALLKDLVSGEVTSVEGRLDASWQEEVGEGIKRIRQQTVETFLFSVRQESFEVQPQAYQVLKHRYENFRPNVRVYFTPRSRQLLSIETLRPDPDRFRAASRDASPY